MDIHEDATICERQSSERQLPATKASATIVLSGMRLAVVDWNKNKTFRVISCVWSPVLPL